MVVVMVRQMVLFVQVQMRVELLLLTKLRWLSWLLQRWCERGGVRSEMNGGGGSGKMNAVAAGENEEVPVRLAARVAAAAAMVMEGKEEN
ncbi:hypothetical protein DEO72_LG6g765 [Vigna unguiculata]|uniref:Uncharacterized protein n=1 Tax=Vigna unguiculata TaxID=3917 RepID=A0A4D6M5N4_VIGUN|nr:hypothetical protein DEO72_LG6g765 [Vigna unguiculata]